MKKQLIMGIAAAAVVALLGTPAIAAAADGSTPDRYTRTNGVSTPDRYARTNDGSTTDRFARTNGVVPNPFGRTNGVVPNPFKAN